MFHLARNKIACFKVERQDSGERVGVPAGRQDCPVR